MRTQDSTGRDRHALEAVLVTVAILCIGHNGIHRDCVVREDAAV